MTTTLVRRIRYEQFEREAVDSLLQSICMGIFKWAAVCIPGSMGAFLLLLYVISYIILSLSSVWSIHKIPLMSQIGLLFAVSVDFIDTLFF